MLCTLADRAPEGPGRLHEIKLDGYRIEAVIAGAKGRLILLLGAWRGGQLIYLGRVGSSIAEAKERDLHRRLRPLRRPDPPFAAVPGDRRRTTWVVVRLPAIERQGRTTIGLRRLSDLQRGAAAGAPDGGRAA